MSIIDMFNIKFDFLGPVFRPKLMLEKGTPSATWGRSVRSTTRHVDRKLSDLAFADDIDLLETDSVQAQSTEFVGRLWILNRQIFPGWLVSL